MGGFTQVRYIDLVCVAFSARCANTDKKRLATPSPVRHRSLRFDLIARINDGIHSSRNEGQPIVWLHKCVNADHLALRIDECDTLPHRFNFGHADSGGQRVDLSIDVGLSHMVHINQRQLAHPASSQSFSSPRTDSANARDGHVRITHCLGLSNAE